MTLHLFESKHPIKLDMPDADVWYFEKLDVGLSQEEVLERLISDVPWEQRTVTLWGKQRPQPRMIAWYGDPGCDYSYSGIHLKPLRWTELLCSLKQSVEAAADFSVNSGLLNLYRDHRDSMGFHSDDEPELGPRPTIASLSLGADRTFVLKHKSKQVKPVRLRLESGSLLLMKGDTQRHWLHGINKQTAPCGPRVNLTFRHILSPGR